MEIRNFGIQKLWESDARARAVALLQSDKDIPRVLRDALAQLLQSKVKIPRPRRGNPGSSKFNQLKKLIFGFALLKELEELRDERAKKTSPTLKGESPASIVATRYGLTEKKLEHLVTPARKLANDLSPKLSERKAARRRQK